MGDAINFMILLYCSSCNPWDWRSSLSFSDIVLINSFSDKMSIPIVSVDFQNMIFRTNDMSFDGEIYLTYSVCHYPRTKEVSMYSFSICTCLILFFDGLYHYTRVTIGSISLNQLSWCLSPVSLRLHFSFLCTSKQMKLHLLNFENCWFKHRVLHYLWLRRDVFDSKFSILQSRRCLYPLLLQHQWKGQDHLRIPLMPYSVFVRAWSLY